MENASKALIIAGAILLSILIISLGLMVYNNAKNAVGSADMSEQQITAFNSKFTDYEGANISGSQVNALIQMVVANNQSELNAGNTNKAVSISGSVTVSNKANTTQNYSVPSVATSKTYKVELKYTNSLVSQIVITANK